MRKMLELANQGLKFDQGFASSIRDRILQIPQLDPFDKLIALLRLLNDLAKTKKYCLLCEKGLASPVNPVMRDRINKVLAFLADHYNKKFTLKEVANRVHMTEESFSRFFSAAMRRPFFRFVNEYRVNIACKLLIETDKKVAIICYECGYQSLPFFYREFKKVKACSPRRFRSAFSPA
jgi:YesN/AraC family two-component response regulator